MQSELLFLIPIFFTIAVFYSAAGFGGGSSYLAILALFSIEFSEMRMIALLCNIAVVSGSLYLFYKHDLIRFRKILPLLVLSIPLAFIGGKLRINEHTFFLILAITLLLAAIFMLFKTDVGERKISTRASGMIGGVIGFLSGIVGIGGGIFLSPVLHLSRWDRPKVIAATTAAFIFVNSIAGLFGQITTHGFHLNTKLIISLILSVIIGGQIGSRITISKLDPLKVRKITAILILFVSIRLIVKFFVEM